MARKPPADPLLPRPCACGCGKLVPSRILPPLPYASETCRVRIWRRKTRQRARGNRP